MTTTAPRSSTAVPTKVEVADLHKRFGSALALRGVDLEVPDGSVTAVLGPSGSGKTTLLRLLAGFDRPDRGRIAIGGAEVEGPGVHVPPERRRVGYVPQEGGLFPHLDVRANIGFGVGRGRRAARVDELLQLTGLGDYADRFPHQLSGGQQQRVALARALAPGPALVLLDEPFTALDASLRASLQAEVSRILRDAGTTAVLVTHDQDEAFSLADRVVVMRKGAVVQVGSPADVYDHPVDPTTAGFVGEANLLPGILRAGRVRTPLGDFALAGPPPAGAGEGTALTVLLRPEQLALAGDGPAWPGTVVASRYHGHGAVVHVRVDEGGLAHPLSVRILGSRPLRTGERVRVVATGPVEAWLAAP